MSRILLATDFDGTVAAIVRDPAAVRMDDDARAVLLEAAALPGVDIAFLSGRDLDDLERLTTGIRAYRSGSHGRELRGPGGEVLREAKPWEGDVDPDWLAAATRAGIRLERKRFGVAAHWRDVEGVTREHALVEAFVAWAAREGLQAIDGRAVVEAAVPGGSKLEVLRAIAGLSGATRVLYAGDDLTDLPAVLWASRNGTGIFVVSAERDEPLPADVVVVEDRDALVAVWRDEIRKIQLA